MSKLINQAEVNFTCVYPNSSSRQFSKQSNQSLIENMTESLIKSRISSKKFGFSGDEIEITLLLNNTSEYDISVATIVETLSQGLTFKESSIVINQEPMPQLNPANITLENGILSEEVIVISYVVIINNNASSSQETIQSKIVYSVNEQVDLEEDCGTSVITIIDNEIVITKTSNKQIVKRGDIITYSCEIANLGSYKNTELTFTDIIPVGTTFVDGSVKIDGTVKSDLNPASIQLDDLDAGAITTVSFDVFVN